MFIKVWCEYDIAGEFGGNNNEDVFEVDDALTEDQITELLDQRFDWVFQEIKEDGDTKLSDTGLLDWSYINIVKL